MKQATVSTRSDHPHRWSPLVLALAAAVALLGGLPAETALGQPDTRPASGAARRPNILLLFSDQHCARILGCAGHPDVKTPQLDRLAAGGMRFERAYCQDAICVPSRTSLMTGLYPRSTGILFNGDHCTPGVRLEPLADYLRRNGYRTGAFGKRHLTDKETDAGWDVTATSCNPKSEPSDEYYWEWVRKIGQWDAFERDWDAEFGGRKTPSRASPMASQVSHLTPDATMEAWTARKAIGFIRQSAKGDKPFFCWASFYRPHQPYTPLPQYYALYDQQKLQLPASASLHEPFEHLPPQLWELRQREKNPWCFGLAAKDENLFRHFLACYYGCLTEIDVHIGEIMEALRESGQADNTIVLYTADHGDFVGCHGLIEKHPRAHNIYEDTLRVPLIINWPGHVRKGDVRQDLVELVDLYPTLLELVGLPRPDGYPLPGRSLVPTLESGQEHGRRFAICENPYMLTVVGPRMKLGAWLEKQRDNYPDMLFDRAADPLELSNLISAPSTAEVQKELRGQMGQWVRQTPVAAKKPLPAAPQGDAAALFVCTRIRYFPAPGAAAGMVGGAFTGSAVSRTNGFEVLAEIKDLPPAGQWSEVTFDNKKPYRWLRYEGPKGSFGKIGELEFYAGEKKLNASFPYGTLVANDERAWRITEEHIFKRAFDGNTKTWFESPFPDGAYVGIDLYHEACVRIPGLSPAPGSFDGPVDVSFTCGTPGAVIRYTLDGTLPSPDHGQVYAGRVHIEKTATFVAVGFLDGLAPSPPISGTYLLRSSSRPGLSTAHLGNSITETASRFADYAKSAGYAHDYAAFTRPGAPTKQLWDIAEAQMVSNRVLDQKEEAIQKQGRKRWDLFWNGIARLDAITVAPRVETNLDEEAQCEVNFFKLACAKSPGVQPWIYVTHEWFMQQCQRSADISAIPSSQMRTLYPALSWEESQSAMLLYAEELQLKDCRLYKTGKRPRILPVALAWGWLRNRLDRGQIPGLAPGSFFEAFFWDQIHPSDHIVHGGHANGAYLLDLTWFAAFYRESPEGKVLPINTTLNAEQAAIVQRLAWDVIRNYPDCGLYEEGTTPVGKPEFSPGPSAIKNVTPLTLTSMTPGAWFRYTLDGTEPARTRGYVYCGVISVRTGMTVKAIAYKSGMADSPVVTATYPDKK